MSHETTKTIFRCSTQVQRQPGCKTTCHVSRSKISYLGSRGIAKSNAHLVYLSVENLLFVYKHTYHYINCVLNIEPQEMTSIQASRLLSDPVSHDIVHMLLMYIHTEQTIV